MVGVGCGVQCGVGRVHVISRLCLPHQAHPPPQGRPPTAGGGSNRVPRLRRESRPDCSQTAWECRGRVMWAGRGRSGREALTYGFQHCSFYCGRATKKKSVQTAGKSVAVSSGWRRRELTRAIRRLAPEPRAPPPMRTPLYFLVIFPFFPLSSFFLL